MKPVEIEFPGRGSFTREWLEAHPQDAQELMAQCKGQYPRCRCREPGLPLYVAQRQRFYLARLPNTGPKHAPFCSCYEPEPGLSGRGIYSASAVEDSTDGNVTIKLGVPLLIRGPMTVTSMVDSHPPAARLQRETMELRGLLHLIWERAAFNRWFPRMRGRRKYRQIHKYVLDAAESIIVRRRPLTQYLYVPEPFFADKSLEIEARRQQRLQTLSYTPSGLPHRVLVLGAVRSIVETPELTGLRLAHLPNEWVLRAEPTLLAQLRQTSEFAWIDWPLLHAKFKLMVLLTLQRTRVGHWQVHQLASMVTTEEYIPVQSMPEALLVERMIAEQRVFVKPLPYDAAELRFPNFLLADCGPEAVPLEIVAGHEGERTARHQRIARYLEKRDAHWVWEVEDMSAPPTLLRPAA